MKSVQMKTTLVLIHVFLFIVAGNCDDPPVDILLFTVDGRNVIASPELLDPQATTVLVVPGWNSNGTLPWIIQFGQVYHSVGNYNVLSLDWSEEASNTNFFAVVLGLGSVAGSAVKKLVNLLLLAGINDLLKVHIIGHSLGAQLAGSMTYILNSQYNLTIGRLTGLDPGAFLYEYPIPNTTPYQFYKGTTVFTDAVHTSGNYVAQRKANADADFYVNGGLLQNACANISTQVVDINSCSHESAHVYYTQTILRPNSLIGCKNQTGIVGNLNNPCRTNQYAPMGEFVPWNTTGIYWVTTNASVTDIGL